MTEDEFVRDRGFDKLLDEELIGRHVLDRMEGFISPEELVDMIKKVSFRTEDAYWEIVNEIVNL